MGTASGSAIEVLTIPLAALLQYSDPTRDDPWGCGRIYPDDVLDEVGYSTLKPAPPEYDDELYRSYEYNTQRIAYFVEQGWDSVEEDGEPIVVDIGTGDFTPEYLILDGNHRVAAAKLRGDSTITVEIFGEVAKAEAVFVHGISPKEYASSEPVLHR